MLAKSSLLILRILPSTMERSLFSSNYPNSARSLHLNLFNLQYLSNCLSVVQLNAYSTKQKLENQLVDDDKQNNYPHSQKNLEILSLQANIQMMSLIIRIPTLKL